MLTRSRKLFEVSSLVIVSVAITGPADGDVFEISAASSSAEDDSAVVGVATSLVDLSIFFVPLEASCFILRFFSGGMAFLLVKKVVCCKQLRSPEILYRDTLSEYHIAIVVLLPNNFPQFRPLLRIHS